MRSNDEILREINRRKNGSFDIFSFLIMVLCFVLGVFAGRCSAQEFLISDFDFTNQEFTYSQTHEFITSFKNNIYTPKETKIIFNNARKKVINIIAFLAKIQMESGTIKRLNTDRYKWRMSRVMAFGMYIKENGEYKYLGFEIQIDKGSAALRDYFNIWEKGKRVKLRNNNVIIIPLNASSYSLFCYTPFFGEHNMYNRHAAGNSIFMKIFEDYKNKWIERFRG